LAQHLLKVEAYRQQYGVSWPLLMV
jgi:hypothetical protein